MRTIEELKADMEIAIALHDEKRMNELYGGKALFYMRDIPLFRLEAICNAERENRCAEFLNRAISEKMYSTLVKPPKPR